MLKRGFAALAAIGVGVFFLAEAQAMSLGEFEYRNSCAQCHGVSGKGDGPVASSLAKPPPDLTMLQKPPIPPPFSMARRFLQQRFLMRVSNCQKTIPKDYW